MNLNKVQRKDRRVRSERQKGQVYIIHKAYALIVKEQ